MLVESVGMTANELKPFLIKEIDEFLEADKYQEKYEELHDVVFALKALAYAHLNQHIRIDWNFSPKKMEYRLRTYATISKSVPIFSSNLIRDIPIGIVHFAFGCFKRPWSNQNPVKNGTEYEILMLTDNEYKRTNQRTNHAILTFDRVSSIEYSFLSSSGNRSERNIVLVKIPDFLYKYAKERCNLQGAEQALTLQIEAALTNLVLLGNPIFHFHSWESGIVLSSECIEKILMNGKKIFSPYLTISRLNFVAGDDHIKQSTLDRNEQNMAQFYESHLVDYCDITVVESTNDKEFYENELGKKRDTISVISFSKKERYEVRPDKNANKILNFITGGRAVHEKGYFELCKEVPLLVELAKQKGLGFNLQILCKEYDHLTGTLKRNSFIESLQKHIDSLGVTDFVQVENKVSLDQLRLEISRASALIVPSLYDPYCLMPHYAIDVNRISFVSNKTGISENIRSREYVFDPSSLGSLHYAIKLWLEHPSTFVLENVHKNFSQLYLEDEWH